MEIDGWDVAECDASEDHCCPLETLSWADLRRLQDVELAESLALDKEADVQRQSMLEIEEAERARRRERQGMRDNELESKRIRLGHEASMEDVLLAVRFPSGRRACRNFSKSDPVASIYDFVETQEDCLGQFFSLVEVHRRAGLQDLAASVHSSGLRTRTTLLVMRDV